MNQLLGTTLVVAVGIWWWVISRFDPTQRFTGFFINKSLADTAVIVMGISFLIGPLCRIVPVLARVVRIRKYFGLVGFSFGVGHIMLSLFLWNTRFPLSYYLSHIWGIIAGIMATGIFILMTTSSNRAAYIHLGAKRWKQVQRFGYLAMFLLVVHISIAAMPRWELWWKGQVSMPNSAMVAIVIGVIFLIRGVTWIADQYMPLPKKKR